MAFFLNIIMIKCHKKESVIMNYNKPTSGEIKFHKKIQELFELEEYNKIEKYLRSYYYNDNIEKKNSYLILCYVKVLRENYKFEESIEIAESMLTTSSYNYFIYELILNYISLNKIEKAYDYYLFLEKNGMNFWKNYEEKYKLIEQFLKSKLYILNPIKYSSFEKVQISTYSLNNAIEHVIHEHSFSKHGNDKSYFFEEINISELINQIKEKIDNDKNLIYNTKDIVRKYFFKMEKNIGYNKKNMLCDIIVVITTWNNEIITLYPVHSFNNAVINYMNIENEEELPKVKRKSQIEKFKEKYNL